MHLLFILKNVHLYIYFVDLFNLLIKLDDNIRITAICAKFKNLIYLISATLCNFSQCSVDSTSLEDYLSDLLRISIWFPTSFVIFLLFSILVWFSFPCIFDTILFDATIFDATVLKDLFLGFFTA